MNKNEVKWSPVGSGLFPTYFILTHVSFIIAFVTETCSGKRVGRGRPSMVKIVPIRRGEPGKSVPIGRLEHARAVYSGLLVCPLSDVSDD